jgi:hypothetical protein
MNDRLKGVRFSTRPPRRIDVSVPPASNVPEGCFEYSDATLIMDTTKKKALSFMFDKLKELAERRKEYQQLPENNRDRLVFEVKHRVLVTLFLVENRGLLKIDDFQEQVEKWHHYDPDMFTDGVYRALEELNLL